MANKILNTKKLEVAIDGSKYTKSQIAEMAEMSRVTLDNVIKGKEVGLQKFLKLCDVLKMNVGYFFDEDMVKEEYHANDDRAIAGKKIKISKIDNKNTGNEAKMVVKRDSKGYYFTSISIPQSCSEDIKYAFNLILIENDFLKNQLSDCRERIEEYKERISELKQNNNIHS